jgi:hypothetical protein
MRPVCSGGTGRIGRSRSMSLRRRFPAVVRMQAGEARPNETEKRYFVEKDVLGRANETERRYLPVSAVF